MLSRPADVYRVTRKKRDQVWNTWVMRPLAAVVVATIHRTRITPNQITLLSLVVAVIGSTLLALSPTTIKRESAMARAFLVTQLGA